ncbi:cytochrome P450 [Anaerobacillus isosaccharinicus]|uniref:Cytochrome P450 n=1 Tax=Anaerobacillus isosaccharinicus TaxID=1532552 RepID=A0A1S2L8X2_9BACI|nr:cytochrome P450 [Anaerobacillus isosaccharinicus]MBA5585148.1 cytochrome P450 [Anaerobacillus isosaccharinicus]QOY36510.1 cytochrome P450 [Anaerobacillus isosaccharinicus]
MSQHNLTNSPPGPKGKLFTGHLKQFQADPLKFLTKLTEEYGDFVQFRLGPFQKIYLINDSDLIKEVLVTKQNSFVKSKDIQTLKTVVGDGLLTSEKNLHKRQRKLIQPSFKRSHITNYGEDMISTTQNYISNWREGEEKLISKDMMNITLGIISKTMFNMNFEEGAESIGEPMEDVMKLGVNRMRSIVKLPLWFPTKKNRKLKKAIQALDEVLYEIINYRKQELEKHHEDLLGVLMSAKNEDDGLGMSDKQLKDELMTIFLAGHETTANALTWTFYLLAQHPEVEKKLHRELDSVIRSGLPTPAHFTELSYTQNIVREALRLYPPAYIIGRQVDKDVQIGKYHLKKGEMVVMSQYVTHRSKRYFEKPNSFIPERFEDDFMKILPSYAYFPFGGGPRVCIGNHFALMETVLVTACIAQRYKLTLAKSHHDVKPQPLITLRPKHGVRMVVKERKSN